MFYILETKQTGLCHWILHRGFQAFYIVLLSLFHIHIVDCVCYLKASDQTDSGPKIRGSFCNLMSA